MLIIPRDEPVYEHARKGATWNVEIVKVESLTIGVRSGGHSWSANHVRAMPLDQYQMKVSINAKAMTAAAIPIRVPDAH